MMTQTTRDVVVAFLDSLDGVRFRADEPLPRVERRLILANMLLAEVGSDDLEEIALLDLAEVTRELCLSPQDIDVVTRFRNARRCHLEVVTAGYNQS